MEKFIAYFLLALTLVSCSESEKPEGISLFNGKTMEEWESIAFGGEGKPYIKDKSMILSRATAGFLTGVRYIGKEELPTDNYELVFEASRLEGNDFFAGATFPIGDSFLTLILGGWAGSVCGLSNLDGVDAFENETRFKMSFEDNKWYKVRIGVSGTIVKVWIDDETVVNVDTAGKDVDLRQEVILTEPLGFSSYLTTGAVRNIRLIKS